MPNWELDLVHLVSSWNRLFGDSHLDEPRGYRGPSSGDETTRVEEEEYRRITRIIRSLVDIELKGDPMASKHLRMLGKRRHCYQVGCLVVSCRVKLSRDTIKKMESKKLKGS